ncbi:MAG: hypothetical protein AB7E80_14785 [Hyphomicrobiaceae bacterium]
MATKARLAVASMIVLATGALTACGDGGSKRPLPPEATRGNGATPYPGPLDETLTAEQRDELRQRGNLQR